MRTLKKGGELHQKYFQKVETSRQAGLLDVPGESELESQRQKIKYSKCSVASPLH